MKKSHALMFAATTAFAASVHAESMKPGLWEFATQMNGAGMPAMPVIPEAQRKQMEAMGIKLPQVAGGGMAITNRICITPEQARKGVPPSEEKGGEKCEQTNVKTVGKTTTWQMACTGKQKVSGQGVVTHHDAGHFSGETSISVQEGPQGPMNMTSKFDAKFISADCKAK